MYKPYKILIKKAIILVTITFLPLGLYLYLNDEVQTTFKTNIDNNRIKYILNAELCSEDRNIRVHEKIIFFNNSSIKMDKIYFYLNSKVKIHNIKINKKKVGYRIIGRKNILMVILSQVIESGDSVVIDIYFSIDLDSVRKKGYFELGIWYPVIIYHDSNRWDIESAINNTPQLLLSNHSISFFIPLSYSLDVTNIRDVETKFKYQGGFYKITDTGVKYVPIIIEKN